jgi:hypothetical protein
MSGPTLRTHVHVAGRTYPAGISPPADIAVRITNPAAWHEQPATTPSPPGIDAPQDPPVDTGMAAPSRDSAAPMDSAAAAGPKPPPRSGRGSGLDAWQAFATHHGVDVPADADRETIIAACERAGLVDPR